MASSAALGKAMEQAILVQLSGENTNQYTPYADSLVIVSRTMTIWNVSWAVFQGCTLRGFPGAGGPLYISISISTIIPPDTVAVVVKPAAYKR